MMIKKYSFRIIALTILCWAMGLQITAQPTPPAGKMWEVVPELSDEFDSWDNTKWRKSLWNYGEPVQMRAENSGVTDGKLWIKATLDEGATRWFETSRVMSYDSIKFPMYIECSMQTAHISAYNTFWLNNGDIDDRDEIDICENNSKPSGTDAEDLERPTTMHSQYFIVKNGVTERAKGNFNNENLSSENPLRGVAWNEAYHTLGMWWVDENNVQFYLNGEPAGSVSTTQNFTLEQFVIWDLWTIDEDWSGGIAIQSDLLDDDINTMYVDWVHTYKLVDDPNYTPLEETVKTDHVTVYPNPANDLIKIKLIEGIQDNASVKFFNSIGSLVKTESLSNSLSQLSLSELPSGLYFLQIQNGSQHETLRLNKN